MQDATDKAFIFTAQGENSKIRLDPKGTSLKFRVSGQDSRDRGSGSVYFTPSSTPLREVSGSPTKVTKNLYNSVYQNDDKELNWSNSNTGSGKNMSTSKRTKPP